MRREFNDTGLCVRKLHYMVDTSEQINEIFEGLVEQGKYFSILGGRQFGKTTTIELLVQILEKRDDYLVIETSFEGIGDNIYENEKTFCKGFLKNLSRVTELNNKKLSELLWNASEKMEGFDTLSKFITNFSRNTDKKIVLIIDEVDKSTNSQVFLSFLGILRDKYLLRNKEKDYTFHSIVLAGVHDIKTIKLKLRPNEIHNLNSPWNIAADLNVDLSFQAYQIVTMLDDFLTENPNINIPKKEIAEKIFYYTNGYPYLVSKICKIIYEDIIKKREDKNWYLEDVKTAFKMITYAGRTTTLFQSNAKNLQNNDSLYKFIYEIVIDNKRKNYAEDNRQVYLARTYGLIRDDNGKCKIHNRIFAHRIYDLILSIMDNAGQFQTIYPHDEYYKGNDIDLEYIFLRFQNFFKKIIRIPTKNLLNEKAD